MNATNDWISGIPRFEINACGIKVNTVLPDGTVLLF